MAPLKKPDYLDLDDDNDRVPTKSGDPDGNKHPENGDTYSDEIPDYLAPDDDGDHVLAQILTTTAMASRRKARATRTRMGSPPTSMRRNEAARQSMTTATACRRAKRSVRTRVDGKPNYLDDDADGDKAPDRQEGGGDANGDGVLDFLDPEVVGKGPRGGGDDVGADNGGGEADGGGERNGGKAAPTTSSGGAGDGGCTIAGADRDSITSIWGLGLALAAGARRLRRRPLPRNQP